MVSDSYKEKKKERKVKSDREVALEVINKVHRGQGYSNLILSSVLRREKVSAKDAAFVTELVNGTLRNQGTLDWVLARFTDRSLSKLTTKSLDLMRLGVYQLFYMAKVPPHAAVNETVELARKITNEGMVKFVNAVLREISRERANIQPPDPEKDPVKYLSVLYSHPAWLVEKWVDELGLEEAISLMKADNIRPKLTLRVNTLKNSPRQMIMALRKRGIDVEASLYVPEAVQIDSPGDVTAWPEFKKGLFTVQGIASMLVSYVVNVKPGETVLDLCAAPGGKATHLAQMMRNEGKVIAVDINAKRLDLITETAKRLGINIIETKEADGTRLDEQMTLKADKVLVDAPCSGLGVLAKRPDARWSKSQEMIKGLVELQLRLLDCAARFVRPQGTLVYSTCTISKDENEDVVKRFLLEHPGFELDDVSIYLPGRLKPKENWAQFYPHQKGLDGVFIARMVRK